MTNMEALEKIRTCADILAREYLNNGGRNWRAIFYYRAEMREGFRVLDCGVHSELGYRIFMQADGRREDYIKLRHLEEAVTIVMREGKHNA